MENVSIDECDTKEQLNSTNNTVSSMEEPANDSQEETETEIIERASRTDEEQKEKLCKLPIGRIRNIAKMDEDVNLINQEAIFLITKSTELFIDSLAKEAYKYTVQSRKKILQKRDIQQAVDNIDALAFLEGMLEQWT